MIVSHSEAFSRMQDHMALYNSVNADTFVHVQYSSLRPSQPYSCLVFADTDYTETTANFLQAS